MQVFDAYAKPMRLVSGDPDHGEDSQDLPGVSKNWGYWYPFLGISDVQGLGFPKIGGGGYQFWGI